MTVYALAPAQALLEAIECYEAVECDLAAISVAWMRQMRYATHTFEVRSVTFPAVNFSAIHLILSPLVREKDGQRTLADFAEWLQQHQITHIRITGHGNWTRQHEFSRNGGKTWGRMRLAGEAPPQPAPTQVLEPDIPPPPAEPVSDDDLPWDW